MNTPIIDTPSKSKMDMIFKWLVNQGVSTVLLFAGAIGVWKIGPEIISENRKSIQQGYERMQEMHTKETEMNLREAEAYKSSIERIMKHVEKSEGLTSTSSLN